MPPPEILISIAIVIFFAVGLHEYAHCKFADMAGDPTPGIYGRLTLNLTKHFEPLGTMMMFFSAMFGYGIGWGKPAPMNPEKMRNPRWDFFMAVIAGPISNVVQAVVWAVLAKVAISGGVMSYLELNHTYRGDAFSVASNFFILAVRLNLSMALFNLLPIGPLDGHWLLGLLMPEQPRLKWFLWNRHFGRYVLIGIVLVSQLARGAGHPELNLFGRVVYPLADFGTQYLLGLKG